MRSKILALRYLLKSRLPDIKRWEKVDVVTTEDKKIIEKNQYLRDYATDDSRVYVCWHSPKVSKNHHPFEIKDFDKEELLDSVIEKSATRLKNKSKPYR